MAGENALSTVIVTTRAGARPLGVRGEPLHNAAAQLRRVVRRRLGDHAADLLADPQLHEDGRAIDWYAGWPGEVKRVADLEASRRAALLASVDLTLGDIGRLGQTLAKAGGVDDSGLIGRSLQLAARHPAESFVFLVGDRPVVVCWGYEKEAASGLLATNLPRVPEPQAAAATTSLAEHRPVLQAPAVLPVTAARVVPPAGIPWLRTLLAALPFLLLLLIGAWLLRSVLPGDPALSLATREGPPAPPAPAAGPDPLPAIKASLNSEETRAKTLQIELAAIEAELKKRIGDCKPVEQPKPPPRVAIAPPPAAPKPEPVPAPAPPPPPRNDGKLRLPSGPTNDYSFMQGCWRTDPFRHETAQSQPGISSYCFDSSGYGQLEWRRGRTACRTRAQARFDGSILRLRDADTNCNDGSRWYADQLVCQRGADNVAQCNGNSRGALGPASWSVNLHKLN
jgi:hypothetical protein